MLNREYRMHDQLYAHLMTCIYKEEISSEYSTSKPSEFLEMILGDYLSSFLHFLDVLDGEQKS